MNRVALYSRFSDDSTQTEASIDQQERLLQQRANHEGWDIVGKFADKAISGTIKNRSGFMALVKSVEDGLVDVVLSESVDRISRDQEDIAWFYKRCQWNGVPIVTLLEGEVNEIIVAMKGGMSALYIKDLARRVYRGQQDNALAGESTGGKAYGYNVEPRYDEKGNRIAGLRAINEAEAAIVRRIFEEYCNGKSPRAIAVQLNAEGIPSQGGRPWQASTIYGNRKRLTGTINNPLYVGRQCWNKQRFRKNPANNTTNGKLKPESEWIWTDVPIFASLIRNSGIAHANIRHRSTGSRFRKNTGLATCSHS